MCIKTKRGDIHCVLVAACVTVMCEAACVVCDCCSVMRSPSTTDTRRPLAVTRPTPPSQLLLLTRVSRHVTHQRRAAERSQSLDMDPGYVPRQQLQASRHASNVHRSRRQHGVVVAVRAEPPAQRDGLAVDTLCRQKESDVAADRQASQSRIVTRCDDALDRDDCRVPACRSRDIWLVGHTAATQQGTDSTKSARQLIADDTGTVSPCRSEVDSCVTAKQSQLTVDDDDSHRQPSAHTDASLDCVPRRPAEWSQAIADRRLCQHLHQRQQQQGQSGSPARKRLTLSCVMADFSGLLQRMRRMRVGRTDREHETYV